MEEQIIPINTGQIHYLIQQLKFSRACILLEPMLEIYPKDPKYYQFKLIIASLKHDIETCKVSHKYILENFSGTALEQLAKGLFPGEKIANVKSFLNAAVRLDSKNPYLFYFLASTYLHEGNYKESLKFANKCLKLDPNFHLALFIRKHCYFKFQMIEDLITDDFSLNCYVSGYSKHSFFESLAKTWEEYKKSGKKPLLPVFYLPDYE